VGNKGGEAVSDNITLPRAVVWRLHAAFRDADKTIRPSGEKSDYSAEIAALDAALAEPDAKREPATHGEISEKFYNAGSDRYYRQADYRLGWRAAERHHGIGGSK
jgi:hypothetical protein